MTLANMRLNGVRSVIAACANCGRSADVNVDLLPESLTVPEAGKRLCCSQSRPDPLGIRAHCRAFLTIGVNGRRCLRPPLGRTATARPLDPRG